MQELVKPADVLPACVQEEGKGVWINWKLPIYGSQSTFGPFGIQDLNLTAMCNLKVGIADG